ncbi:GNAT family N-acetyltransferase [Deinococcus aquiradiocola]|uniref:GNAT family N-acetyltransferase n=1 Tax=Deinococcus aquiradiocola TaxID=393059 RepID=A0A917PKS2_9DEIO|nr:GNAT family N-acetyltransferase [Deinococcus aquiradiocola]GGJ83218.1 GNAT family N-acetyltransferase [Deinococcus aquiradiocola]
MTPYTFDHVTADTLPDHLTFVGVHDPAPLQARLADGRLAFTQLRRMRSPRGTEASWTDTGGPLLFPRVRTDLPTDGVHALARELARGTATRVILNEGHAPLTDAPWQAAGWTLDPHAVMALTDLTARTWPLDPRVQERPLADLLAPDLLDLYAALTRDGGVIGDTGGTDPHAALQDDLHSDRRLHVLTDAGQVLGAALLDPDPRGAGIHMLGVRPDRRGHGLGGALHAHLLAVASRTHARHGGTTEYANHAMRRIFERNGCTLTEQKQFVRTG